MNIKSLFAVLFFFTLFSSCMQENKSKKITKEKASTSHDVTNIVGTWITQELNTKYNIHSDSAYREIIISDSFASLYGFTNVQAEYFKDGQFTSAYIDLEGKPIHETHGTWFEKDNLLYIVYDFDTRTDTFVYDYLFKKNIGIFKTLIDWDKNGTLDSLQVRSLKIAS